MGGSRQKIQGSLFVTIIADWGFQQSKIDIRVFMKYFCAEFVIIVLLWKIWNFWAILNQCWSIFSEELHQNLILSSLRSFEVLFA